MTVHDFKPTRYYNTIGSHEPALRIADGDTVRTTTIDAWGQDEHETKVIDGPNPMTGPFYVEGAEPGDTLVVVLESLVPNRPRGYVRAGLAENVVDPDYVNHLPSRDVSEWHVDLEARTVTLVKPETKLGRFSVPLAPMVGCFGVAPRHGQAISTATSAEHGGNMDYREFTNNTTVYFPVFVPGALLHLGDGHALQGHGEIGGTGVEISFNVQFTVRLIKGKHIGWPRGENDEYIFTAGNARPLDQALQHATTEMMRWLQEDYGLDALGASLLLSQCVEYEVGNVFDPAYTMICKIPKKLLTR